VAWLSPVTSAITGVLGGTWRADVTSWGAVVPWDGSPPLDWHVAADDRWHSPAQEPAVRQMRIDGTPVFETRLRVPGGDAVHRVWSVADAGGWTLVEVANDSPLPFACAFTRSDVVTNRPPADVRTDGIELPAGSPVLPVGHRTAVTVALPHSQADQTGIPNSLASVDAVSRGWLAVVGRASRFVLPDQRWVVSVVAGRCDLLLAGPPCRAEDPVGYLLAAGELVRLGELDGDAAAHLAGDVAVAAQQAARVVGWDSDAALDAAILVLARAGERRAVDDVARIAAGRVTSRPPSVPVDGIRAVAATERRLARGAVLFPDGIPTAWHGAEIEAHGLVAGPDTSLSFAVRWHGERPALLWQIEGVPVELRAPAVDPDWSATAISGETLWPPHPRFSGATDE
jgi:hypothetical protein